MNLDSLKNQLESQLAQHMRDDDGSHDVHHVRRVWENAQQFARHMDHEPHADSLDWEVVLAAVYLHDLVNVPKNSPNRRRASALSAEAARPLLRAIGFPEHKIDAVAHAIEAHSFSAGITPQTEEARIVQDADRIESLGALGIARTFYTAGRMNSLLFDADDPFGKSRDFDDQAFAIDHFKKKLLNLPDTMQTAAGRQVACERVAVMRAFLKDLGDEIGDSSPW